jgi:predicted nuclease of predicted toxin-antitoxin system
VKFLVDQQLPPALSHWLTEKGHYAEHTDGIGFGQAPDDAIAAYALQSGSVMVTRDSDFVQIRGRSAGLQILWVRTGNCTNEVLLAAFEARWAQLVQRLQDGEGLIEIR